MGEGTPQLKSMYYLLYRSLLPQLRIFAVISAAISVVTSVISLYFFIDIYHLPVTVECKTALVSILNPKPAWTTTQ